ncbi:hypothetical protein FRC08_011114 [Ceratobasidium sp. 394]|nr:hypothetical protein FRC08_011114 [Ceratobasidium sp. 394]
MSAMSLGLRESSRTLMSHDIPHQSGPPLALRRGAIERGNGLPYATTQNALPLDGSPRLPTPAARARAVHSGSESAQVRSGILHPRSGSPVSEDSPVSRASPSDLSDDDCESPRRGGVGPVRTVKNHSRRQPPGHIPRPKNAFILYRSWYVKEGFLADVENDHREISRIVGRIWRELPDAERDIWRAKAEEEKREHALKHPNYKYSPNSRRDAAAPPARSAPVRTSAARARKAKSETPSKNRLDSTAEAFLSVSRQHGLANRVRERNSKELEVVAKRAALASDVRALRSGQLAIDVQPSSQSRSLPGYPVAAAFDLPYGMLPTDYDLTGSYFDQLQQSALAQGMPFTSATTGDSSTQDQSDMDLLEEWCAPDSPVFTDDTQTPTASVSSGAPSPPLPLESPAPKYPQPPELLCSSWAADDLDAYRYALGGVRAELDGHGIMFGGEE